MNHGRSSHMIVLNNATVLDADSATLTPDQQVVIIGNEIVEVGAPSRRHNEAQAIDLRGTILMPGLIDSHVHVTAISADLSVLPDHAPSYIALHAARELRRMLHRGFTSVRDMGGADFGLADAISEGLIEGPRLFFGGKALSQTGGHGDTRRPGRNVADRHYCCPDFGRVADGVDACRHAARDELRKGAHHLKLMLSGGAATPTDRIDSTQFSIEEIAAVVDEAAAANRYVAGHAYTPAAINRALRAGVRTIEHGNFLDAESVNLLHAHDAFLVPTLTTYQALADDGLSLGLPEVSHRKILEVLDAGMRGLETAHQGGVNIAFGTDLLGRTQVHQLREFTVRSQIQDTASIIRSATTTGARLLDRQGSLGVVQPGALADLIAIDADPLDNIAVLTDPERHLKVVIADGRVIRDFTDR